MKHLNKKQLEELKKRLLEEKAKIVARYNENLEVQKRVSEEAKEPQDLEDLGQINYTEELLESLSQRDMEVLKEIEDALKRIENGTYGICEWTGEPIPYERLKAIPWTRFTAKGAEEYEETMGTSMTNNTYEPPVEDITIERDDIGED